MAQDKAQSLNSVLQAGQMPTSRPDSSAADVARDKLEKLVVQSINSQKGYYSGCDKCNGRGFFAVYVNHFLRYRRCECWERQHMDDVKRSSGIPGRYEEKQFKHDTDTAQRMRDVGAAFTKNPYEHWLFLGGTTGSGKTHLASAISDHLTECGMNVKFNNWPNFCSNIKAHLDDYQAIVDQSSKVELLVMDDVFRVRSTDYELIIAYEILNARYENKLPTIITSEKTIAEIRKLDSGIGGRISEMSRGFRIEIKDKEADRR